MKLFYDKKGEELISFYEILIYLVICVVIVGGTTFYYLTDVDVRKQESGIFYNQIIDCLIDGGILREGFLDENFDFFESCDISKKLFDNKKMYVNVQFLEGEDEIREPVVFGNYDFKSHCEYKDGGGISKHWSECFIGEERIVFMKDGELKKGKIKIMAASNNEGNRVK